MMSFSSSPAYTFWDVCCPVALTREPYRVVMGERFIDSKNVVQRPWRFVSLNRISRGHVFTHLWRYQTIHMLGRFFFKTRCESAHNFSAVPGEDIFLAKKRMKLQKKFPSIRSNEESTTNLLTCVTDMIFLKPISSYIYLGNLQRPNCRKGHPKR